MAETQSWMDDLEAQVSAAAEEIGRLRTEVAELQGENERLRAASEDGADGESGAWLEERETVRRRVEALATQLESLLTQDA